MVLLAVCAAVYFPLLGRGGLTSTEGHRAIPGWEMLESGNWRVPTLFGQMYLRKPPGMPWAVAASSKLLGETEFAARLPSALAMTGMSLLAMFFASRWFGRGAGLAAGLATALTPWFWSSGRSAEIEALNNLFSCAGVLLAVELLANRAGRRWWGSLLTALMLGGAVVGATLAKGPAGFAAIGSAVVVGIAMVGADGAEPRSVARVRAGLWLLVALMPAAAVLGMVNHEITREVARVHAETQQTPIEQGVTEFLWSKGAAGIGRVLLMPVAALAAGLPCTAALFVVVGKDDASSGWRMARALAATCLVSLAAMLVLGVWNHRYAMPSVSFVPVLAGLAWTRWPSRVIWGSAAAALVIGAAIWIGVLEPRARAKSGREAGMQMAPALMEGMVWGDQMVESRPETMWYAKREAARLGRRIEPRWVPGMAAGPFLPRHGFLLMRDDEEAKYRAGGFTERLTKVWEGRVHKYPCALYRKD